MFIKSDMWLTTSTPRLLTRWRTRQLQGRMEPYATWIQAVGKGTAVLGFLVFVLFSSSWVGNYQEGTLRTDRFVLLTMIVLTWGTIFFGFVGVPDMRSWYRDRLVRKGVLLTRAQSAGQMVLTDELHQAWDAQPHLRPVISNGINAFAQQMQAMQELFGSNEWYLESGIPEEQWRRVSSMDFDGPLAPLTVSRVWRQDLAASINNAVDAAVDQRDQWLAAARKELSDAVHQNMGAIAESRAQNRSHRAAIAALDARVAFRPQPLRVE